MGLSLAEQVLQSPEGIEALDSLSDEESDSLLKDWHFWARPEQLAPAVFGIWLILTGRGWGKTRTGAETIADRIEAGTSKRIAFIAATAGDARDTMVDELREGAGLLSVCERRGIEYIYEPSKNRIVFPKYKAVVRTFSAEKPDRMRGPQFDTAWFDEFAAFPKNTIELVWSNVMFGLRHGDAVSIITTTPKPVAKLREIMTQEGTIITSGTTYDNKRNLTKQYFDRVIRPFEGTRMGQQELMGLLMTDNPDALWTYEVLERNRVHLDDVPQLDVVVIGVDPIGSATGHECGIVAAGKGAVAKSGLSHGYLLGDYSMHGTPKAWAIAVIEAYDRHQANYVVIERNYGGDMVKSNIEMVAESMGHGPIQIREVTATRGKAVRAEPISALDEQGRLHHVIEAHLAVLETQMCDFESGGANDRVDARVWAFTELIARAEYELITW